MRGVVALHQIVSILLGFITPNFLIFIPKLPTFPEQFLGQDSNHTHAPPIITPTFIKTILVQLSCLSGSLTGWMRSQMNDTLYSTGHQHSYHSKY